MLSYNKLRGRRPDREDVGLDRHTGRLLPSGSQAGRVLDMVLAKEVALEICL